MTTFGIETVSKYSVSEKRLPFKPVFHLRFFSREADFLAAK